MYDTHALRKFSFLWSVVFIPYTSLIYVHVAKLWPAVTACGAKQILISPSTTYTKRGTKILPLLQSHLLMNPLTIKGHLTELLVDLVGRMCVFLVIKGAISLWLMWIIDEMHFIQSWYERWFTPDCTSGIIRIHYNLMWRMGDKTIPDEAPPSLESFYPPWVAGIDLPQPRCCGFFVSFTNKHE